MAERQLLMTRLLGKARKDALTDSDRLRLMADLFRINAEIPNLERLH